MGSLIMNNIPHSMEWFREPDWDHHRATGRMNFYYELYGGNKGFVVKIWSPFERTLGHADSIEQAMEIGNAFNRQPEWVLRRALLWHKCKCFLSGLPIIGNWVRLDLQYKNYYDRRRLARE